MHVRMVALVSVEMIWKKSKQFVAGTCLPIPPMLILNSYCHIGQILHLDICAIWGGFIPYIYSKQLHMVHFNE